MATRLAPQRTASMIWLRCGTDRTLHFRPREVTNRNQVTDENRKMARRPFPHLGKMKRIMRAVQATGERMERLEVHGDDFVVVLAKRDEPESDVDPIHGLDAGEAA